MTTATSALTGGRTRVLGGITVSDTPLIADALDYAQAYSEPYLFTTPFAPGCLPCGSASSTAAATTLK